MVFNRIYSDFLMPSRVEEYGTLLHTFLDFGYKICSIEAFWETIKSHQLPQNTKTLILRHDIDTDPVTTRMMWEIEQDLNIQSSYYFRLSTVDISLMKEIAKTGSEVSYHFEEIATVAKEKCLKTKEEVIQAMPLIKDLFQKNLLKLREKTQLNMSIVASHGDFVNRKLGIFNWEILQDQDFRQEVGVELEVYDNEFMQHISSRHSDTLYPSFWKPANPLNSLKDGDPIVYILVHPRHWRTNFSVNLLDNINRLWEGYCYANSLRKPLK